ncbi:hypothetical protein EJ08DRAFT_697812 [Tothia fuscella]|uniref:Uncharacterized protein n=1 Tax=Tothia fuscella TaxID=1048955 RepID=A0A9P4NRA4_9PEZI|nr:hypothetical protein EJ08DRAFT_697812 [Tothia fuscella]
MVRHFPTPTTQAPSDQANGSPRSTTQPSGSAAAADPATQAVRPQVFGLVRIANSNPPLYVEVVGFTTRDGGQIPIDQIDLTDGGADDRSSGDNVHLGILASPTTTITHNGMHQAIGERRDIQRHTGNNQRASGGFRLSEVSNTTNVTRPTTGPSPTPQRPTRFTDLLADARRSTMTHQSMRHAPVQHPAPVRSLPQSTVTQTPHGTSLPRSAREAHRAFQSARPNYAYYAPGIPRVSHPASAPAASVPAASAPAASIPAASIPAASATPAHPQHPLPSWTHNGTQNRLKSITYAGPGCDSEQNVKKNILQGHRHRTGEYGDKVWRFPLKAPPPLKTKDDYERSGAVWNAAMIRQLLTLNFTHKHLPKVTMTMEYHQPKDWNDATEVALLSASLTSARYNQAGSDNNRRGAATSLASASPAIASPAVAPSAVASAANISMTNSVRPSGNARAPSTDRDNHQSNIHEAQTPGAVDGLEIDDDVDMDTIGSSEGETDIQIWSKGVWN